MPLTHVSLRQGKPASYRRAILDGIYAAMRETFDVRGDDRFMVMTEHAEDTFVYGKNYLGIARTDDLVIIQLTVSATRTLARKNALYKSIVTRLAANPGVRPRMFSSRSSR
jgi:hypothetical protein